MKYVNDTSTHLLSKAIRECEYTRVEWSNWLWGKLNTPRRSFISWLTFKGGLYTKAKLKNFGMINDDSCVLCQRESETIDHLWFQCCYSKEVMNKVCDWACLDRKLEYLSDWIHGLCTDPKKEIRFNIRVICLTTMIYYIWVARNSTLFRCKTISPPECACIIEIM